MTARRRSAALNDEDQAGPSSAPAAGAGWGAIKDDFVLGKELSVKDWDQNSSDGSNAGREDGSNDGIGDENQSSLVGATQSVKRQSSLRPSRETRKK